jgi:hypothetical protein
MWDPYKCVAHPTREGSDRAVRFREQDGSGETLPGAVTPIAHYVKYQVSANHVQGSAI